MGLVLKTIAFPFPNLASITSGSVTNFAQITVDLPESTKTFRSVWVDFMCNDIVTATGSSLASWNIGLSVNSSAYTTVSNATSITTSAENTAWFISQEFTTLFTTSYTGTSHTVDCQVTLTQSGGTTLNFRSGSAILWITYEYDDTSSTQVANAWIPMNSLVGALGTSKVTVLDTVPALDTFLGYGSISYKHIVMLLEGNESVAGNTTDFALTVQLDNTTAQAGNTHEAGLASDRYVTEVFNLMSGGSPIFTTNATHSFYAWVSTGAVGRMNHATWTMLVTFTFDATSGNQGNISLILPMDFASPAGGTTTSDYQKADRELWVEEGNPTIQNTAFRYHWEQIAAIATIYARCGSTLGWSGLTDTAAALCGGNVYQQTCHATTSIARGRNYLSASVYRTDTTDKMWNISGCWIVNYICDKPTSGWGVANHTVMWSLQKFGTGTALAQWDIAAIAPIIPESNYFINALGIQAKTFSLGAVTLYGYNVVVEKLSAEGGVSWEPVYVDSTHTDPELGLRVFYAQMRTLFKRFIGDAESTRMDIETSRRWKVYSPQNVILWISINLTITYHSITYNVAGSISGSNGGTVDLYLHKGDAVSASNAGERLQISSRSGDGAFSFTHYDDVEAVYVTAIESSTSKGVSQNAVAGNTFDIQMKGGATDYAFIG